MSDKKSPVKKFTGDFCIVGVHHGFFAVDAAAGGQAQNHICRPVLILCCKRLQSKVNINSDGVFRVFAVPPEILCQQHTPVALVCQYVLHIFVLLFKFDYADICKMTK
ncbi:hypothetical protein, partial [Gemmiger sp.]|uniref:hypothetical protein n=1 Tax=Gemmiger sp. TaxID=2049027 RepID=UPI002A766A13